MLPFHQLLLHSCNANLQMSPPKMFQTFPNKCHIAVPDIKNKDCKDCPYKKLIHDFTCENCIYMRNFLL